MPTKRLIPHLNPLMLATTCHRLHNWSSNSKIMMTDKDSSLGEPIGRFGAEVETAAELAMSAEPMAREEIASLLEELAERQEQRSSRLNKMDQRCRQSYVQSCRVDSARRRNQSWDAYDRFLQRTRRYAREEQDDYRLLAAVLGNRSLRFHEVLDGFSQLTGLTVHCELRLSPAPEDYLVSAIHPPSPDSFLLSDGQTTAQYEIPGRNFVTLLRTACWEFDDDQPAAPQAPEIPPTL